MKKNFLLFSIIVMLLTFSIQSPTVSNAASLNPLSSIEEQLSHMTDVSDKESIKKYQKKTKDNLKKSNIITEQKFIKFKNAKLIHYNNSDNSQEYYIYTIPIIKKDTHEVSNLTFTYDFKGELIQYQEMLVYKNQQGTTTVSMFSDGKQVMNEIVNEEFKTAEEFKQNQNMEIMPFFNADRLARCLGISVALATTIGMGCTAACFALPIAGCVVCVSVAAGLAGGSSSSCIIDAFF